MATQGEHIYELGRRIRMDLSNAQAKLTEMLNMLRELQIEDRPRPSCPACGLTFKWVAQRDEHVYTSHGGPVPKHWEQAEANALLDDLLPDIGPSRGE